MGEQVSTTCPVCHEALFDSEFGPMCLRALQSWKHVDDRWKHSFAGHPEINREERHYLEKHGMPPAANAAPQG